MRKCHAGLAAHQFVSPRVPRMVQAHDRSERRTLLRHLRRPSPEYDFREGAYWVPIEGQWWAVPERAIIRDRGNPVGEAVVWYVHHRGGIVISCFVPADAV
jgi:hypothetical protein